MFFLRNPASSSCLPLTLASTASTVTLIQASTWLQRHQTLTHPTRALLAASHAQPMDMEQQGRTSNRSIPERDRRPMECRDPYPGNGFRDYDEDRAFKIKLNLIPRSLC